MAIPKSQTYDCGTKIILTQNPLRQLYKKLTKKYSDLTKKNIELDQRLKVVIAKNDDLENRKIKLIEEQNDLFRTALDSMGVGDMKFNREKFIGETCADVDAALDCIEELVDVINGFIGDDDAAGFHGGGCYGKHAEAQILSAIQNKQVGEYIEENS